MTTTMEPNAYAAAFQLLADAAPAPVADLRRRAFERFETLGFPTLRDEEWRYTNVRKIAETAFARALPEATVDAGPHLLADTDCDQLVFVDGRYRADLSTIGTLPPGVKLGPLAPLLDGTEDWAQVEAYFAQQAAFENEAFTALNTALVEDGAGVYLPAGVTLERPLHFLFITSAADVATHPRVLAVAEANAAATIVETYAGPATGTHFTNTVTEIIAADGANVDHYKVNLENVEACHVSSLNVKCARDTRVTSHNFTIGGGIVRNDVNADLTGTGGEATFNGLSLPRGDQHVDNHLRINHLVPHCNSWEFYKGILDDKARTVFSGRIYVAQDAQKTDAKQTNQSLLLSDDAGVTTKPQLEIFADDVKCTHGATIGQIEEAYLFYLQARGIDRESARAMLIHAFANETIAEVQVPEVRRRLERCLLDRLPEGHALQETV